MQVLQRRMVSAGLVVGTVVFVAVMVGQAQQPAGTRRPNTVAPPPVVTPATSSAAADAEREQIWNSPNMLRARAWLQDYCSKSAKVTPEMAKTYQAELANMTPNQMKLWLLKFDHEESQRQQQYSLWQQSHQAAMSQAMAANQATQRVYGEINRDESAAAGEEQQQINEQTQAAQDMQEAKQLETTGPYGAYGYPGYGGIHYHYHLYPNSYPY